MTDEELLAGILVTHPELARGLHLEGSLFGDPSMYLLCRAATETGSRLPAVQMGWLQQNGCTVTVDALMGIHDAVEGEPSVADVRRLERSLRGVAAKRQAKARLELRLGHLDLVKKPEHMERWLSRLSVDLGELGGTLGGGAEVGMLATLQRARSRPHSVRFPCGIPLIDTYTRGMKHGQVWIISAPYKSRKSSLALNMAMTALNAGRSVAYICLEDDEVAFTDQLLGLHADCDASYFEEPGLLDADVVQGRVTAAQAKEIRRRMAEAQTWAAAVDKRFRPYDYQHGVHDPKRLLGLIWRDKQEYGTDLVVLDYLQAFGEDYDVAAETCHALAACAIENQVCLLEISQMNNQSIMGNLGDNMLGTKGFQWAAAAHVGLELHYKTGEFTVGNGARQSTSIVSELGVYLKVARRAPKAWQFADLSPISGRVTRWYDQPRLMVLDEEGRRVQPAKKRVTA